MFEYEVEREECGDYDGRELEDPAERLPAGGVLVLVEGRPRELDPRLDGEEGEHAGRQEADEADQEEPGAGGEVA